jgi:hypothetical protein
MEVCHALGMNGRLVTALRGVFIKGRLDLEESWQGLLRSQPAEDCLPAFFPFQWLRESLGQIGCRFGLCILDRRV